MRKDFILKNINLMTMSKSTIETINTLTDKGCKVIINGFVNGRMWGDLVISQVDCYQEIVPFGGIIEEHDPHRIMIECKHHEKPWDWKELMSWDLFTLNQPRDWSMVEWEKRLAHYIGEPIAIHWLDEPLPPYYSVIKEEPYNLSNKGLEDLSHNITVRTVFRPYPTLEDWLSVLDKARELISLDYVFSNSLNTYSRNGYCLFHTPSWMEDREEVELLTYKPTL
jgi:hypothetical protein